MLSAPHTFFLILIGITHACGANYKESPDYLNYDETVDSIANMEGAYGTIRRALRVLVRENVPFTLQLDDDTFSGIEVELVKALAKNLRLEIEFILDNNRSTLSIDHHP